MSNFLRQVWKMSKRVELLSNAEYTEMKKLLLNKTCQTQRKLPQDSSVRHWPQEYHSHTNCTKCRMIAARKRAAQLVGINHFT